MTWTYTGNPADSNTDAVRFLAHDIDQANQRVQDEEIDWALSETGNVYLAAALICDSQSAANAGKANKSVGDLRIEYSALSKQFSDTAARLRDRALVSVSPYLGGRSRSDKESVEDDSDRAAPFFQRDQFEPVGSQSLST